MPAGPLTALCAWLERRVAPPDLEELINTLLAPEDLVTFRALVDEYLPECEAEIQAARGAVARVSAFAKFFEKKYFPLSPMFDEDSGYEEGYAFMTSAIYPFATGWSSDDWDDDVTGRDNGHQLLYVLGARCGDDNDADDGMHAGWEQQLEGMRVTALEACRSHTKAQVLRRIPEGGWTRKRLHQLLDGTEYQGAAEAADWFRNDTGNGFLDTADDDGMDPSVPWGRDNVSALTIHWVEARAILGRVTPLARWLEADTNKHFGELLDFIEKRDKEVTHDDQ
jgi:hypothetical protein